MTTGTELSNSLGQAAEKNSDLSSASARTAPSRLPVSVLLVTFNEEQKITRCLESLTFADEIVLVDALSTDRTPELVRNPHAPWASKLRFFSRKWNGFREQRNFALDQAQHEWVLVVDADEIVSEELKLRIEALLQAPSGPSEAAYKVHRQEFFMGKRIFHGMWNPSYQDRFFKKTGVRYVNDVHEYPKFPSPPGLIHESLLHHSHLTVERYLEKLNHYTSIEALDRYSQGQRTSLFKLVGAFPAHFLKSLFYYGAYKDGIHGVVISLLEGVSRVVRQIKIWQKMMQETSAASSKDPKKSSIK